MPGGEGLAVEIGILRDTGDFFSHRLIFLVDQFALISGVGISGCLFCKLFHTDELGVDNAESAVCSLDHGDTIVCVTNTLTESCNICTHEFANCEASCIVSCRANTKTRR